MCDFLLTLSLILGLAGLSSALWALIGSQLRATCATHKSRDAALDTEVFGQTLVETYFAYRQ